MISDILSDQVQEGRHIPLISIRLVSVTFGTTVLVAFRVNVSGNCVVTSLLDPSNKDLIIVLPNTLLIHFMRGDITVSVSTHVRKRTDFLLNSYSWRLNSIPLYS